MPENNVADMMKFIGLLTHNQKQAGYFVTQTEDFVFLWRSRPHTDCVSVWIYDDCLIRQVRDKAEEDMKKMEFDKMLVGNTA